MIMLPLSRWLPGAALACAAAFVVPSAAAQHGHPPEGKPAAGCLPPATWAAIEETKARRLRADALLADMAKRDVVLLGEQHDDDDHHRWQLQTLAALHALRPDMVIGFESFPRRVQPVLDRWVAGELSQRDFLKQVEWDKVWNMPPELYLPLFHFARLNRIPMVALNVERSLNKAILERGWEAVPGSEREGVGTPAPASDAYRAYLKEVHAHHVMMRAKGEGEKPVPEIPFEHFVQSQTIWDRAMAEALASRVAAEASAGPLVVGIMGSGHVRFGYGVPHQLRDLGVKRVGTLLPLPADQACEDLRAGMADAVFTVPNQALGKAEPPRLGVRLEEREGAVHVVEVTPGSLAERSGLRNGDRLLEVGGTAPDRVMPVIAQVRLQPGGTWLPMRVRRGGDTVDLVVKFPLRAAAPE